MSIGPRVTDKLLFWMRIVFIFLCGFLAFGGHYPPVLAQKPMQIQEVPVLTVEDAVQDNNIKAMNDHLVSTDATVRLQWTAINKLVSDVSGMQGEERIIGVILGLISTGGIILQVRKKAA
jgi:hypothetical protein